MNKVRGKVFRLSEEKYKYIGVNFLYSVFYTFGKEVLEKNVGYLVT